MSAYGYYNSINSTLIDLETNAAFDTLIARHRLVATRFCKPRSKETWIVDHWDEVKGHDLYTNLRWVTNLENASGDARPQI
jgi:hypothetical protein